MTKTTRTTNRLHFEDLDPKRFEDLCLQLVYKLKKWVEITHIGRAGNDKGVDIIAIEDDHQGKMVWYVQCKRQKSIYKHEFKVAIDKIQKNYNTKGILLFIVSCDLTKQQIDYVKEYARKQSFIEAVVWTQSILETKLYNDYPDLLYTYFGIKIHTHESELLKIKRDKKMKEKLKKDLMKKYTSGESLIGPRRFKYSDIVLKAVNENDKNEFIKTEVGYKNNYGWYSSMKLEPYHIGDEGFELIFGIKSVKVNTDGCWDFVKSEEPIQGYNIYRVIELGFISFENIKEYDLNTDDGRPYIYCLVKGELGPFTHIEYEILDLKSHQPTFVRLNNSKYIGGLRKS